MILSIEETDYELSIDNDASQGGMRLKIHHKALQSLLIEIFRNDEQKRIDFFIEIRNVSIELVEKGIEIFNEKIGREFKE